MTFAAASMFLMPCLMMGVSLAVGKRLEGFPGKDDVWTLPRTSSLR